MTLLAQAKSFWGDDAVSQFFAHSWIVLVVLVLVAIVVSRRRKR
jgi:H+/gluconate symporter-like permease